MTVLKGAKLLCSYVKSEGFAGCMPEKWGL